MSIARGPVIGLAVLLTAVIRVWPTGAAADGSPVARRDALYDFEPSATKTTLGNRITTWSKRGQPSKPIHFELRPSNGGHALYFSYQLDAGEHYQTGLRLDLKPLDATAYDHLELRVKGDAARGYADTFKIELTRPEGCSSLMIQSGSQIISGLTDEWQTISVPLNRMSGISDWTCLDDFVITLHPRRADVLQGAYYIDDIALTQTGHPGPNIHDPVPAPRKQAWKRQFDSQRALKTRLKERLVGWPNDLSTDQAAIPDDRQGYLRRLAHDTWRGIRDLTDREHGLPMNNIRLGKDATDLAEARIGDYANVTDIGLYLLSIVAAHDLGFIDADQARAKLTTTLATLEQLETYRGFFYNYYDTVTLERTSNFLSFVDSSWLTAALMVVRQAFPDLGEHCTRLINKGDYGFFYDDVQQLMSHGYYVNLHDFAEYHYGLLYTESRLGSLIAIGKGEVPKVHWYRMLRTFPAKDIWQSLTPRDRTTKTVGGYQVTGGYYQWDDNKYVPSWGGSLFEALMPTLLVDEPRYAPNSLGINDVRHARLHRLYALHVLGYPVWGMSPSSTPRGDRYAEYGVKFLGSKGYGAGAVTPHVSALALNVTPAAAAKNLQALVQRYAIYGDYGLYDSVDPISGRVAHKYLLLDQAMMLIALTNYLADHSMQRHFAADPIAARALSLLGKEHFFE